MLTGYGTPGLLSTQAGTVNVSGHSFDKRFGIWIQSHNSWTLDEESNMVWPAGEGEESRQGPLLWVLLGLLAGLTLATVALGLRRVAARYARRRAAGQHGHWSRKPTSCEEADDDSGDEDFFLRMSNRLVF